MEYPIPCSQNVAVDKVVMRYINLCYSLELKFKCIYVFEISVQNYSDEEHLEHFDDDNADAEDDDWGPMEEDINVDNGRPANNLSNSDAKKDNCVYDNFIIEENDYEAYDEDPFDPSVSMYLKMILCYKKRLLYFKAIHNLPLVNALSPQTSRAGSPDFRTLPLRDSYNSKRLNDLNKERMRAETQYFREKAAYYRMQKYLVAMQTKKFRREFELSKVANTNVDTSNTATNVSPNNHNDMHVDLPHSDTYTLSVLNVSGDIVTQ